MKIDEHIKNLEKYCEVDDLFEKDGDFKEFCDGHITDIKAVIKELKNTQSDLYEANHRIDDLLDMVKQKDRIIDEMMKVIIDSEICKKIIKNHCVNYAGENKKTCDNCLKEYFEKRCKNAND